MQQQGAIRVVWWNDAQQIIFWEFPSKWTWEDYYSAVTETNLLGSQVQHNYSILADIRRSPDVPRSAIMNVVSSHRQALPHFRGTVLVGTSPFIKSMLDVLWQVAPTVRRRFSWAETLEDGEQMALKIRQSRANFGDTAPLL